MCVQERPYKKVGLNNMRAFWNPNIWFYDMTGSPHPSLLWPENISSKDQAAIHNSGMMLLFQDTDLQRRLTMQMYSHTLIY